MINEQGQFNELLQINAYVPSILLTCWCALHSNTSGQTLCVWQVSLHPRISFSAPSSPKETTLEQFTYHSFDPLWGPNTTRALFLLTWLTSGTGFLLLWLTQSPPKASKPNLRNWSSPSNFQLCITAQCLACVLSNCVLPLIICVRILCVLPLMFMFVSRCALTLAAG